MESILSTVNARNNEPSKLDYNFLKSHQLNSNIHLRFKKVQNEFFHHVVDKATARWQTTQPPCQLALCVMRFYGNLFPSSSLHPRRSPSSSLPWSLTEHKGRSETRRRTDSARLYPSFPCRCSTVSVLLMLCRAAKKVSIQQHQ